MSQPVLPLVITVYTFGNNAVSTFSNEAVFTFTVPGNISGLLLPAPSSSHPDATDHGADQEPPVPPPRPTGRSMSVDASKGNACLSMQANLMHVHITISSTCNACNRIKLILLHILIKI